MHRKAMKLSDLTVSKFKVMFSFMILFGVLSASLTVFRIFQIISYGFENVEVLLRILYITIEFVYIMVGNYLAQEIIDHSNDVYISVYKVQWYMAPLQIQKLILFLLQRGTKVFTMNIAGLFVGSLEGAATLLSTVLSYFTVLHSTQR
ncbi:PREDICTED: uncharacterized protein LOC105557887 [Vollenhovia emeryi]|uniref:uncharacterized protein LOC105557887 n=1 Tax=Vollenhovia emeryi TaxID=411798 RepID=UPI0005F38BD6|nr:PREDICTED: uncharacterized protein LOC105557887 [Vollenhovia emeryi]